MREQDGTPACRPPGFFPAKVPGQPEDDGARGQPVLGKLVRPGTRGDSSAFPVPGSHVPGVCWCALSGAWCLPLSVVFLRLVRVVSRVPVGISSPALIWQLSAASLL